MRTVISYTLARQRRRHHFPPACAAGQDPASKRPPRQRPFPATTTSPSTWMQPVRPPPEGRGGVTSSAVFVFISRLAPAWTKMVDSPHYFFTLLTILTILTIFIQTKYKSTSPLRPMTMDTRRCSKVFWLNYSKINSAEDTLIPPLWEKRGIFFFFSVHAAARGGTCAFTLKIVNTLIKDSSRDDRPSIST